MRAESPDLVVYLALADGASKVDRSAVLLDVWDRLQPAKFNVSIVGRRSESRDERPSPPGPAADTGKTSPPPAETAGTAPVGNPTATPSGA